MLDNLRQDIRFAVRTLARAPGFTVAAVATLGLGIGATALVFSMANTMLLRPFPYADPSAIVQVDERDLETTEMHTGTSYPNFLSWRETARSFSSIAAFNEQSLSMRIGRDAEHFEGAQVSAELFPTLGMKPILGRQFLPAEDTRGGPKAVMLSYALWQKDFNGARDVIGRTVYINAAAHTVIGVMPPKFAFPARAQAWVPFQLDASEDRGWRYLSVVARLKDGISADQASVELKTISAQLEQAYPGPNGKHVASAEVLQAATTREIRPIILILLGAVGFVLLIACANVANLMLARAAARDREMAIRGALGAGGARLIRQLLTESLMIALLGGGVGILFGAWWLDLLVSRMPAELPYWMSFSIDRTVLLFVAAIAVVTSVVFGLAPALQAGRADLQATLKEGGRATVGQGRARMRSVFVVSQLAAAMVLLVGALLMVRSFLAMQSVDPGFNQTNIVTMQVDVPRAKYDDDARVTQLFNRLIAEVDAIPGVERSAAVSWFPISGSNSTSNFSVEGIGEVEGKNAYNEAVSPAYFHAMGIPVVRGRVFDAGDRAGSLPVAIVNQKFVDTFFPGTDPIGKRVMFGAGDDNDYASIVGVVANVNERDVNQKEIGIDVYMPLAQIPQRSAALVVSTRGTSASVLNNVRERVRKLDADISVFGARTVEDVLSEATWDSRLTGGLFSVFALGALLLAGIGLYGVIAYSVSQRTHEIGVRVALGATRDQVIRMVLGQGLKLTAIGLGIGLALSFGLTRVLSNVLFGVTSTDPYTFAIVPALLAGVALLATYLPARRATRVDPITALRTD